LGLFILGFADSVRVVSQKIADSIHSLSHNIEVLPINVSQNAKLKVKDDSQKQKSYGSIEILTVCRLENEKDLETAIRAFKEAVEMGANATFTIVGDGSQREYLKNLSKTLNLESRIFFVGWQNDLEEYYKNADIYISTSLYEGYGMSSIEAAMHGLPLILSNTGVAGSIFKDGREAIICGQKNVDSFTGAIIRLASDSGLRKEIGERARDSANSVQVNREEYLRRYKNSISDAIAFYNNGQSAFKKSILLRYFCAGITGASTQIGLLYLFTDIVGIWYIYSSMMAFAAALCVSFLLQKFWTFNDRGINKAHHQFLRYFGVAVAGILINTALMFLFVDIAGIWYILAQVIAGAFIMVFNFLMYKFFIFHKK
jgi:putative flippase GtrA